jgi:hypothetical protein
MLPAFSAVKARRGQLIEGQVNTCQSGKVENIFFSLSSRSTDTTVKEVRHYSSQCNARLSVHPNDLEVSLGATRQQAIADTFLTICLPDSKFNCFTCSLEFKV